LTPKCPAALISPPASPVGHGAIAGPSQRYTHGLSAAAVFLNAYKTPLFLGGIGMNIIGVVVIARQLQRARRACAVVDAAASRGDVPTGSLA